MRLFIRDQQHRELNLELFRVLLMIKNSLVEERSTPSGNVIERYIVFVARAIVHAGCQPASPDVALNHSTDCICGADATYSGGSSV